MTHTPGPWTVEPPSVIGQHEVCFGKKRDNHGAAIIVPRVGFYEEATANAHLIAAAPDLLAACQRALPSVIDYLQGEPELAEALEAAIAKAEAR